MMIGLVVHMTGFTTVYQQPPAPGSWGTGTSCDRLAGGGGLPMPSLQAHPNPPSGTSDWATQLRPLQEVGSN